MKRELSYKGKTFVYDLPENFSQDEEILKRADEIISLILDHERNLFGRLANVAETYLTSSDSRLRPLKTLLNEILSRQIDELQKQLLRSIADLPSRKKINEGLDRLDYDLRVLQEHYEKEGATSQIERAEAKFISDLATLKQIVAEVKKLV